MAQKGLFFQWHWWLFLFLDEPFTNFVQSGQFFLNVFQCSWLEEFNVKGVMGTQNDLVRIASNNWNLSDNKFHIMLKMPTYVISWAQYCFLYFMCSIITVSVKRFITCIEITCMRYTLKQLMFTCNIHVKGDSTRNVWRRLWHKILDLRFPCRRFIYRILNKLRETGLLLNKITKLKLWWVDGKTNSHLIFLHLSFLTFTLDGRE
jgi:hypothetical protein